jgi:hypothetical protein
MPDQAHTHAGSSNGIASLPPPGTRSADQIRNDIVSRRQQLAHDVDSLRGRVNELTDWRSQVRKHQGELIAGAVVLGGLLGVAAFLGRRSARNR